MRILTLYAWVSKATCNPGDFGKTKDPWIIALVFVHHYAYKSHLYLTVICRHSKG